MDSHSHLLVSFLDRILKGFFIKITGIPGHIFTVCHREDDKRTYAHVGVSHSARCVLFCLPGVSVPFEGPGAASATAHIPLPRSQH